MYTTEDMAVYFTNIIFHPLTQQAHDVVMTSHGRRCFVTDVISTSIRRRFDVICLLFIGLATKNHGQK